MQKGDAWFVTNARVVTENSMFTGALAVEGERFGELDIRPDLLRNRDVSDVHTLDFAGDYLLPGLVDLHTDNLERHFRPRPGVYWPDPLAAFLAHDARMVAAGVTTILDSVCAEAFPQEEARIRLFHDSIAALHQGHGQDMLRGRHYLHVRCETADPEVLGLYESTDCSPLLKLVSLMDHTPGQRQYRDVNHFRAYYGSEGWTDEEFSSVLARCKSNQEQYSGPHRKVILEKTQARNIVLASHDDASTEHVDQAWAEGVRICEFPTTLGAAQQAGLRGLSVVMGAPNIMLGGSHSGNVSALEVFQAGLLDILSSDYAPESLLSAVFRLNRQHGCDLAGAVRLVSANPARALFLPEVGMVAPGRRADFLRVQLQGETPVIKAVWRDGRKVF